MPRSLTDIQVGVRNLSRSNTITLTDATELAVTNHTYRFLASSLAWPELRRQDTSLTTTSGTSIYTWISDPIFLDIKTIEIQDNDDQDRYKLIHPPPDEWTWNEMGNKPNSSVPAHWLRSSTAFVHQLELRPSPKYAKTLRVTGIIEPSPLRSANDKTIFQQALADDLFEYLLAANFALHDGFTEWANSLTARASSIIQQLFGKDNPPEELLRQVIQK